MDLLRSALLMAVVLAWGASAFAAEPRNWAADEPTAAESAASDGPQRLPPRQAAKLRTKPETGGASRTRAASSGWGTSLGALVAVVLLILGCAKLMRKHLPAGQTLLPFEACQVLGKRHLDPKQAILFVRCGARLLIVGSGPNGLRTLSEITDPVEIDQLAGLCHQAQPHSTTQAFSSLLGRFRPSADAADDSPEDSERPDLATQRFKDRLARAGAGEPISAYAQPVEAQRT